MIWSLSALVLEVPSGALADLVSRKRLLVGSSLVYGCGFACWTLVPSYPSYALGFVLWSVSSAVVSGTFESYVYDGLRSSGRSVAYPRVVARGRALGLLCNLTATLLAAPLLQLGGFELIGAVSVGACLLQTLVAMALPADVRRGTPAAASRLIGYRTMLTSGLAEVRTVVPVRHAVLVAAALPGFLAFDEYFPLLFTDLGVTTTDVPLLIALVVAAQALGAWSAAWLTARSVTPVLLLAAALLAGGTLTGRAAGVVPIALGYGLLQAGIVVADVRLQQVIGGRARATVTSISGLLSELCGITVFLGFAGGSSFLALPALVVALAVLLAPLALLARRWLVDSDQDRARSGDRPDATQAQDRDSQA